MPDLDLHLHTTGSDGALTPAALLAQARGAGLARIALSDHDTLTPLPPGADATARPAVIPAIELTCRVRSGSAGTVHVLGYGVDPAAPALQEVARRNRLAKQAQVRAILSDLEAREGIDLPFAEVLGERPPDAYLGRHMIAAALVRRGKAKTRRKAFRRYLRSDRVPDLEAAPAEDAMRAIHAAGGLSVLAHPTKLDLAHHLAPLLRLGLRGLEVHRPRLIPAHAARLEERAARHGLIVTGGSDYHGHYPEPPLGTWRPPAACLEPFLLALAETACPWV